METLLSIAFLASLILLVVGFFSPSTSLFWMKQERTKKNSFFIYSGILASTVIAQSFISRDIEKPTESNYANTTSVSDKPNAIGVGYPLHTTYFIVTVNKVSVKERVNTGNMFTDLKQEPGVNYLILNVTFKNTDNESRMIEDGSIHVNYNGKNYNFDKSETLMAEGWGLLLDQINPLLSKTTNLVYKIPSEVRGDAYYNPGRSDDNALIYLGRL